VFIGDKWEKPVKVEVDDEDEPVKGVELYLAAGTQPRPPHVPEKASSQI
jgi:hypothetical protein